MAKITENNEIAMNHQPSGGKTWIAKIIGKHPKYGFDRKFINKSHYDYSSSGKTGTDYFSLSEDGYYEGQEAWAKNRCYFAVQNRVIREIKFSEIKI